MELVSLVTMMFSFSVLFLASVSDWRTREAPDRHWIILGTFGLIVLAWHMVDNAPDLSYWLFLPPTAALFYDIFWDRPGVFEGGIHLPSLIMYISSLGAYAVLLYLHWGQAYLWELMVVPIMFLVFVVMYQLDIVKGGADAKALIALAIVFPAYPMIGRLPLVTVPTEQAMLLFPFSLLVLFNAALMIMVLPLVFLSINIKNSDLSFPQMLFGYRMDVDHARSRHFWPMESVKDGRVTLSIYPQGDGKEDPYADLVALGRNRVWVTPKIPFLIPMTLSVLFSAIVGNLLFIPL